MEASWAVVYWTKEKGRLAQSLSTLTLRSVPHCFMVRGDVRRGQLRNLAEEISDTFAELVFRFHGIETMIRITFEGWESEGAVLQWGRGDLATKRQALGCPRIMSPSNPFPRNPSMSTSKSIRSIAGDATLLIILDNLLLHRRRCDLSDLLWCRNDKFGGTFVADQIVQHRRGRLRDDGFIVVVEQTCSARVGGRFFAMEMEGRRSWGFRGDRDLETTGGGRGSLWTRDHGMWSSGDIDLGSRSLWWRVETSELDISLASRKSTRSGSSGRIEVGEGRRTGFMESGIVARRVLALTGVVGAI